MASLTPGVLSKLLHNAGNRHAKVTGEHRSALLQVIEIVPALSAADQPPWQSTGFFLKLSDSLHSAYVSISDQDIDLIHSDKLQLGQFVYVAWLDSGSPVPVLRGLKPVPKRRPCVGHPTDLAPTDLLPAKDKPKRLVFDEAKPKNANVRAGEGRDMRRLSLDSARKAWDNASTTPKSGAKTTPRFKSKHTFTSASVSSDKKASPRRDSLLLKSLSLNNSPLKNKNDTFLPKSTSKPSRKDAINPSCEVRIPTHLSKVPVGSDQKIPWDALPRAIHNLGKDSVSHKNAAFLAAVQALEEASALEGVINCLSAFAKLCESSQQVTAGQIVEQFLDLHQSMQRASMVVISVINTRLPGSKATTPPCSPTDVHTNVTNKNATSWVRAAIESDLSKFSLFKKSEMVKGESSHVVILENSQKDSSPESQSPRTKQSPKDQRGFLSDSSGRAIRSPSTRNGTATKRSDTERKDWCSGIGLKEAAILAQKLLLASREWFLKYLESSLGSEFGLSKEEGRTEIAVLLRQLKRVNQWLDDLVGGKVETDERIEVLRNKLYRFLLEHVNSS